MKTVLLGMILGVLSQASLAQFAQEEVDKAGGVLNPSDFSWHYYLDQMKRFPDRIGIICYNAYIVEKAGLHQEGFQFFSECAERGSTSAMIQMSLYYDQGFYHQGLLVEPDPRKSTLWLQRAARAGHPWAQLHYGRRLLSGHGIDKQEVEGRAWISKAARYSQNIGEQGRVATDIAEIVSD